jgi:hypothetical protein
MTFDDLALLLPGLLVKERARRSGALGSTSDTHGEDFGVSTTGSPAAFQFVKPPAR